jgi:hypothetical protein
VRLARCGSPPPLARRRPEHRGRPAAEVEGVRLPNPDHLVEGGRRPGQRVGVGQGQPDHPAPIAPPDQRRIPVVDLDRQRDGLTASLERVPLSRGRR